MVRFSVAYAPGMPAPYAHAAGELVRCLTAAGMQEGSGWQILLQPSINELPDGAFRITIRKPVIRIEAGEPCGIVYGSFALLERMGFRFLAPDCEVLPPEPAFPADMEWTESPAFHARELFWRESMDGAFAVRLRLNSARSSITPEQGGKMMFYNFSHSFDALIPVEQWFPTHPEYFSMIGGKRIREKTQLCLSNPEVRSMCIAGVRKWIQENPQCRIFSVSMNDWYNACECPACRAIDEKEGSQAGSVIHFVNAIADDIREDYPEVCLHTFAYLYCRRPPRFVKPRENVIVRLCSIECCYSHPIRTCRTERDGIDVQNGSAKNFADAEVTAASFADDLAAWSRICKNLYIWDYTTNYANYLLPFPNLNVLQDNLRLFREHGVRGVFEQGNFSHGRSSALAQLKIYLLAKLLWNPDDDPDALTEDFINGYYGPASDPMKRYVQLWKNAPGEWHVGIYDMPDAPWLTDTLLESANACIQEALALSAGSEAHERVLREALSIRYALLSREDPSFPGHAEKVEEFMQDAAALGITELFERKEWNASGELLKTCRYTRDRKRVPGITYPI